MDFASLLGGIASFASNLYGTMYGADRADEDRALTLDLFNKSREFQLQDQSWTEDVSKRLMNYQYNKFSSPSAQMQAYRDAGLNPWLASQGGSVGSGQGVSVPGVSNPQRSGTPDVFRPQIQKDLFGDAGALITQASAIHNQRLDSKAKVASAIPDLVKGVGEDAAKRFLSSLFGNDVSTQLIDSYINNELVSQRISNERSQLELDLRKTFGPDKEQLIVSQLSGEVDKLQEECLSLKKGRDLTDKEIDELVTRSARNLAERSHLNADTATINKLRDAIYYEAKFKADSAHSQAQIDSYNEQDRRATFLSESPERELKRLEGTPDNELSPSQRIYKKSSQFWKRLGKVVKNVSPLSP